MPEWEAPAAILAARPYGEADAVVTVLTRDRGLTRGLVRGGASRRHAATWQPGNLVAARWVARLADSLGTLTGELVHPAAALAMEEPLPLAILTSACACAEGALPEHEPHAQTFDALIHLIAHITEPGALAELVHWELTLLAELGYGLDLTRCTLTGTTGNLTHVSPRTGRAVTEEAAGPWRDRLLPLPPFLTTPHLPTQTDLQAALHLTAHFLTRDAFGHLHRPLPPARDRLEALVTRTPAH